MRIWADGQTTGYFSTDAYAAFVRRYVQELCVTVGGDAIGALWLRGDLLAGDGDLDRGELNGAHANVMARRLMLQLLIRRLTAHDGDPAQARGQVAPFQPVIDLVQARLHANRMVASLITVREAYSLSGEDALIDALKRYVRFNRKAFTTGCTQSELLALLLHLQVAAERSGVVPERLVARHAPEEALSAALTREGRRVELRGWPARLQERQPRYREIRDPRSRRFRN